MASMEYESEQRGYDDEPRGYDRDRSRSPRGDRRDMDNSRARSASPNGRDSRGPPPDREDDVSRNPGSNLFVTGIHPSLTEDEVTRLFEKYGEVEQCNIMRDPHTKESRGFGFVKMVTPDQADAAKEGLQGEVHQGRTLSIEKARRARPRTPTPGKYYGPPKREFRGGGRGGGPPRYGDRYEDRRGGGSYGGSRRDDYGGSYGYRGSRYEDRPYRRERDDYGPRGVDRYASRDDRYSREDRRGGGSGYYERPPPPAGGAAGYGDAAPPPRQEAYGGSSGGGGGSRPYEDRGDDYRYSS
ncbi:RNA-binding domain-containing protein [Trematosphaeria pertusa]|uniref:RNA-binding domain-containing protein n=1 Tax=Trematosphaeria pertusa TaxID=390896 RepID=A0A6A6J0W3_9PLEO|nr:RNA-binding domain-containing protein [Trematosphaeria pertusa]KAF2255063.1 RNA-binding domain-containing protein [Trematosphaeria pertusa]